MDEAPVLLVKTHAFGDALMCTPAVRELVREGGCYWALTGPSAAPVWARVPGVERVFVAPVPAGGAADHLRLIRWSLRNIRQLRRVSRSVVFQGSAAVRRWVRFMTGAGSVSCGSSPLGCWEQVFPLNVGEPAGTAYAGTAGVEVSDWRPEFPVTRKEEEWVADLRLPAPLFAIAPGGGENPRDTVLEKRWMPDRFAVIAERLSSSGFHIVLLGGGGDTTAADAVARSCGARLLDLTGRTTWGQSAAILDRCAGFLGADSGTAHLAAARRTPSVVLFGPSSPSALFPPGLVTAVASRTECSPCYANSLFPGCRRERAVCMESVEVEDVWMALRNTIGSESGFTE